MKDLPGPFDFVFIDADKDRAQLVRGWLQSWGFNALAADSLSGEPSESPQAIVSAWQADDPALALETVAAWRKRFGAEIPACLIHVGADADVSATGAASATVVLAHPLQPGQLRAWLRRSGLN